MTDPIFTVESHCIATKPGGRLFERNPSRTVVQMRMDGDHGHCTATVPAEVADTTFATGKRFRLVPVEDEPATVAET
jgi:hypothetical protein